MLNTVAVIMAHPDDAEIWVGGTILNHAKKGDKVFVFYLFANTEERKREAKTLNRILNVEVRIVETGENLRVFLKEINPNIIITHWEKDTHYEHRLTYKTVSDLIPFMILEDGLKFNLYSCDTYNSVGNENGEVFRPDVYIDISDTWLNKMKIIMNHKSQPTDYWLYIIQNQNRLYGARTKCSHAEAFLQIYTLGFFYNYDKVLK